MKDNFEHISEQVRQGDSWSLEGTSLPPHTSPALYFAAGKWKQLPASLNLDKEPNYVG